MTENEDEYGLSVREAETHELMDRYEELAEELGWVLDELRFRFNCERNLEVSGQKNEIAKILNQHEDHGLDAIRGEA